MTFLSTLLPCLLSLFFLLGCSPSKPQVDDEKCLTIACSEDPLTLDPRIARDLNTATVMRMLFEGLMSNDSEGKLVSALAEQVTVSEDGKTYTFILREATWSDGSLILAEDFEKSWKTTLDPLFPAPNAYQLYILKGGKEAKEGRLSLEQVGVKSLDSKTLVVELEKPIPYFLEMTACHFYFPVHRTQRDAATKPIVFSSLVCNGPFKVNSFIPRSEFSVIKNISYWDKDQVEIEQITLQILDENTALQLYKQGKLDWAGSPLSTLPQDAIISLRNQGFLQIAPGAGTHFCRFNTNRFPFENENLRRTFSLSIDRQAIVEHITQGNQLPASGFVPPLFNLKVNYSKNNFSEAQNRFVEALKEMNLTKQQFPEIFLTYAANDRNHKIAQAIQQQWSKAFGIPISLQSVEGQIIFEKLRQGQYQISLGSWYADFKDPINFLELFRSKENPTNQTYWENPQYTRLLESSAYEMAPTARYALLAEAEQILLNSMPIAPLYHATFNYLKKPNIQGIYFSPLGYLDFKKATKRE